MRVEWNDASRGIGRVVPEVVWLLCHQETQQQHFFVLHADGDPCGLMEFFVLRCFIVCSDANKKEVFFRNMCYSCFI
jgi:hypothetical protein